MNRWGKGIAIIDLVFKLNMVLEMSTLIISHPFITI